MAENIKVLQEENIPIISYMQKTDTTANWREVDSLYIPYKGEIVIYQDNYSSFKIGDGKTYLKDLPFFGSSQIRQGNQPSSILLGSYGLAEGNNSISEGSSSVAHGFNAHAMGDSTTAQGNNSISMGEITKAIGVNTLTQGKYNIAHGNNSVAFGKNKDDFDMYPIFVPHLIIAHIASSDVIKFDSNVIYSGQQILGATILLSIKYEEDWEVCYCAQVLETYDGYTIRCEGTTFSEQDIGRDVNAIIICQGTAYGEGSYIEGQATVALDNYQHVQGRYNKPETKMAHIVGNGSEEKGLSNAYTLDWDGNAWFAGDITLESGHKLSEKVNSSEISPMVNDVIANTLSEKTTLKLYFDDNTYSEFEVYQNNSKQNIEY